MDLGECTLYIVHCTCNSIHIMMMWWFDALYKVTSNSFQQLWRSHLLNCIVYRYFADSYLWRVYVWVCLFFAFFLAVAAAFHILFVDKFMACLHEQDTHCDWRAKINTKRYLATFIAAQWNRLICFYLALSLSFSSIHSHRPIPLQLHSCTDIAPFMATWCKNHLLFSNDIHSVDKFESLDFSQHTIHIDFVHQPPVVHLYQQQRKAITTMVRPKAISFAGNLPIYFESLHSNQTNFRQIAHNSSSICFIFDRQ